ncbi:threonine synthase [Aureitalea marina]|uniref:Threonine synthase n=1 Tax=Aureitalea marina TaxID=930804 RepID=A0A2S7KM36_9FLAO|nr:threonine synthase [Aureitalea marina]PQB03633.1 threonine synthase [Aureitalea marina]
MNYISLNKKAGAVSFREAVVRGLAPDKGLYYPENIPMLSEELLSNFNNLSDQELALNAIRPFIGDEIPATRLSTIVNETLSFPFPVKQVEEAISVLELYHGPTLAFKDVGARFMARCLGFFNETSGDEKITVLVATSGDTGGAVADGFFGVEGVEVVILYPKGKVSEIQEKQLTTHGGNIRALEVDGTFDDCQAMVKQAFLDAEILEKRPMTSANSINVARWMPQMFYYLSAVRQMGSSDKIVFSVPSGNYGNICAGMLATKMGLPIHHFITGTNANKVVPDYLSGGIYYPKPSVATISNAMDVGDPSNFIRIRALYDFDEDLLKSWMSGYSFNDEQTLQAIRKLYEAEEYLMEPHGAIGYLALKSFLNGLKETVQGVFLETAHPVKFLDVMPKELVEKIEIPAPIKQLIQKPAHKTGISSYADLKSILLD